MPDDFAVLGNFAPLFAPPEHFTVLRAVFAMFLESIIPWVFQPCDLVSKARSLAEHESAP